MSLLECSRRLRDMEDEEGVHYEFARDLWMQKTGRGPLRNGPDELARQAMRLSVVLLSSGHGFRAVRRGRNGRYHRRRSYPRDLHPGHPRLRKWEGHRHRSGSGGSGGRRGAYLMTHRATKVTGCTEMSDDGLYLTDDKTNRKLALLPGPANIKAGERVELKGKIRKSAAGDQHFLVKSVAKDFGECHTQASAVR